MWPLRLPARSLREGLLLALCLPALLALGCAGQQAPASAEGDRITTRVHDPLRSDALVPRSVFFAEPDRANVRLSPDGRHIAFLAPHHGVLNIHVAPVDDLGELRPLTHERDRGIRSFGWAWTNEQILYQVDHEGDENWVIYSLDIADGTRRALTPLDGVAARIIQSSPLHPEYLLVGINLENPQLHDVYRVNLLTGESELVVENPGFVGFVADDALEIRLASILTEEGGLAYLRPDPESPQGFSPAFAFPMEDTLSSGVIDVAPDGESFLVIDSRGDRDTAALVRLSPDGEVIEELFSDPRADVSAISRHPRTREVQAVTVEFARNEWHPVGDAIAADIEALRAVDEGDFQLLTRSWDDQLWLVAFFQDDGPVRYHLYDRSGEEPTSRFLFTNRSAIEDLELAPMYPVSIAARDGLPLISYLSVPPRALAAPVAPRSVEPAEAPALQAPLPMVLLVHGGPWARDSWGYDSMHQWLANRGYAVLSVNFRGSTGFGKSFINASTGEWGAAMHDDLLDAVQWAIESGVTTADQVAIMGGSYGGYAALVGATFTPDTFACAVSIVGPSNLITLLETIPPYWRPLLDLWATRVGDPRTEEGRALLSERSPLTHVDAIRRPLLIGQGANDPRVRQSESDQIVEAMVERAIPVTYALFPDEGHGFARPENRMAFYAVTEAFLGECLGGAIEPVGEAFEGSSIQLREEGGAPEVAPPAGADADPAGADADPADAETDPADAETDPADGETDPAALHP